MFEHLSDIPAAGRLNIVIENEDECIIAWKVDDFVKCAEEKLIFKSGGFRFEQIHFCLALITAVGSSSRFGFAKSFLQLHTHVEGKLPSSGVTFKTFTLVRDGRILITEAELTPGCKEADLENLVDLGSLLDAGKLLQSDGSLLLICVIQRISEGKADTHSSSAISPLLQYSASVPSSKSTQMSSSRTTSKSSTTQTSSSRTTSKSSTTQTSSSRTTSKSSATSLNRKKLSDLHFSTFSCESDVSLEQLFLEDLSATFQLPGTRITPVGTLLRRTSLEDESMCVVRWTVDNFLRRALDDIDLVVSERIPFGPFPFYLCVRRTRDYFGNETDDVEVNIRGTFRSRFSWKLTVKGTGDRILAEAENVWKKFHFCRLPLGFLSDAGALLHPDGSFVLECELQVVPEKITTDAPSPFLQHPAVGAVKMSARPVKNRNVADGAGNRSLVEPLEGKFDANVSTLGTLRQRAVFCTKYTWTMPNFREHAERETSLHSEKFQFGSRLWQMHLSPRPGQAEAGKEDDLLLSLQDVSGCETSCPYSWKLSTVDDQGTILESSEGVCEDVNGPRVVTLPFGSLQDAQQFLDSDGVLRVVCELHLAKETRDVSCQTESEAGTDVLVRDYKRLLSSGEATDVTVRVKGQREFLLHRAILVARTPVFASMLLHQMSESETCVMDIEDCDPDTFQRFLHFIYTGGVEDLLPEDATELYRVADKYQVDELKSQCLECIRGGLSIESFCPTIRLAFQYCEELTEQVTDFFADNMDDILLTVQWQEFLCNNPIQANALIVKALRKKNALLKNTSPAKGPKI